jgi:hypothetical protein
MNKGQFARERAPIIRRNLRVRVSIGPNGPVGDLFSNAMS